MYSYLIDGDHVDEKAKGTENCVIKGEIKVQDYNDCIENNETILRTQQRFKSKAHNVFIGKVNNISLSTNDDKRMLAPDGVTTYRSGYKS